MPVAISGDGTLTGIAVGGLPDGIVDADMLASNSVQTVKIVDNAVTKPKATGFGKILGYAHVATSSATDVSALSSFTEIGSFALSYTPTVATSKLLFVAQLNLTVRPVNGSYYGNMEVRFKHGSIATTEHYSLYTGTGSGSGTANTFPYTFVHEFAATNTTARDTTVELNNASSTGGNNNGHLYFNEYSGRSSMTIWEVAA